MDKFTAYNVISSAVPTLDEAKRKEMAQTLIAAAGHFLRTHGRKEGVAGFAVSVLIAPPATGQDPDPRTLSFGAVAVAFDRNGTCISAKKIQVHVDLLTFYDEGVSVETMTDAELANLKAEVHP
jgi:hypothetical protein